jgi:hypothetical protein
MGLSSFSFVFLEKFHLFSDAVTKYLRLDTLQSKEVYYLIVLESESLRSGSPICLVSGGGLPDKKSKKRNDFM